MILFPSISTPSSWIRTFNLSICGPISAMSTALIEDLCEQKIMHIYINDHVIVNNTQSVRKILRYSNNIFCLCRIFLRLWQRKAHASRFGGNWKACFGGWMSHRLGKTQREMSPHVEATALPVKSHRKSGSFPSKSKHRHFCACLAYNQKAHSSFFPHHLCNLFSIVRNVHWVIFVSFVNESRRCRFWAVFHISKSVQKRNVFKRKVGKKERKSEISRNSWFDGET